MPFTKEVEEGHGDVVYWFLFPEHNFLILCLIMSPPPNQRGGSGDILNCADPVGVGIHVTVFPFIIF